MKKSRQEYLTVQEVADYLRLSVLTIYKYIKAGELEAFEFGGHYRISQLALQKFIKKHIVGGNNE